MTDHTKFLQSFIALLAQNLAENQSTPNFFTDQLSQAFADMEQLPGHVSAEEMKRGMQKGMIQVAVAALALVMGEPDFVAPPVCLDEEGQVHLALH